jgi:tryptophan synthase alpha chain
VNRIDARFDFLRAHRESAFIPYITMGDPTLARSEEIILALEAAGADIIECGVPFSDPIGDGPVNQEAALRALKHPVSYREIFASIRRVREKSQVPLLLFTYYNPVFVYGIDSFAQDAAAAGADGVLCVDLPPEEAEAYGAALGQAGLRTVFLLAPTSSDARIEQVAQASTGFIYYVSRLGVTGESAALAADLETAVGRIKAHTDKPVAVGFGISTPEQASKVAGFAEGVIVGSAIVRMIGELGDSDTTAPAVEQFVRSLVEATKSRAIA